GMTTKSTPYGSVENPINPIPMAIVGGATYVARAFSGKQKHMVEMFKGAIQHKGFALVDVFSPCVTYNKDNTYQWFNPRVKILEEQGTIRPICIRRSSAVFSGATKFRSDCSGVGPTCKAWKSWNRCCTPARARSHSANSAFPRNKRNL